MRKTTFQAPTLEKQTIEELTRKLLEANANLKLEQLQREEMLSNISHDLRAPITAIRCALDLLMSDYKISPQELKNTVSLIDRRTKTLEDMINDIFYLFCIEDTSKKLNVQEIDATHFLEEYFYDAITDTRYDKFNMQLDIPENLNCRIHIDIQKMIRVLDNLFTNASKYTPEGSKITLAATTSSESHNQSSSEINKANTTNTNRMYLRIMVIDSGKGIPQESLLNIFNRTYTVSSARTPGAETGSGLGLSIVKAITERFNGQVWCESHVNIGSKFIIELPIV